MTGGRGRGEGDGEGKMGIPHRDEHLTLHETIRKVSPSSPSGAEEMYKPDIAE